MANASVSHLDITSNSIVSSPVHVEAFTPNIANLDAKFVNHLDDRAWELWQFDSFSADAETAVSVSFYRDLRTIKQGGFHVDVNAIWPDGSKWGQEIYLPESIVTSDGDSTKQGHVHGIWKSETASITFRIEADLSTAKVDFSVPGKVTGVMNLRCLRSLSSGDGLGLPITEDSTLLGPSVHYIFPMKPAATTADLVFSALDQTGEPLYERNLSVQSDDGSRGGLVRGWSTLAFPQIFSDAYYLNATVGPYMLQLIHVISTATTGRKPYTIASLYQYDGASFRLEFVTNGQSTADTVAIEKIIPREGRDEEEGLSAVFCDKNIGYNIELTKNSTQRQQQWRFQTRHKLPWWSEPTSAPGPQGTGKSGFVEAVAGGLIGEMFEGGGIAGQLQLP